jgi:hypothetical protein
MKKALLLYTFLLLLPGCIMAQLVSMPLSAKGFPDKWDSITVPDELVKFLGLTADVSFRLKEVPKPDKVGSTVWLRYRYDQYYKNILVEYGEVRLHYKGGKLDGFSGSYMPAIPAGPHYPKLTEEQAFPLAKLYINAEQYVWEDSAHMKLVTNNALNELLFPVPHGKLVFFTPVEENATKAQLAYKFLIHAIKPHSVDYVYINAASGLVMAKVTRIYDIPIRDPNSSEEVSIVTYPNPANDLLSLFILTGKEIDAQIQIMDVDFKLVKQASGTARLQQIDIRDLAAGVYYANIYYDGKRISRKFVKN